MNSSAKQLDPSTPSQKSVTGKRCLTVRVIALCFAASLLPLLASQQLEAKSNDAPNGHYCGKLLSGGSLVDIETSLKVDVEGHISGTYRFDDHGTTTIGSLSEIGAAPGPKRVLLWFDRYGSGALAIQFDPAYSHFEGLWAPRGKLPAYTWNGSSCQVPIT